MRRAAELAAQYEQVMRAGGGSYLPPVIDRIENEIRALQNWLDTHPVIRPLDQFADARRDNERDLAELKQLRERIREEKGP